MARKNLIPSYKLIDAESMGANFDSEVVNVQNMDVASIHASWSGAAPVGELKVWARNGSDDTWYELDLGAAIAVSGATGDIQIVLKDLPFTDIYVQYVRTSGTGTMSARITAKQVGG